MTPQQIRTLQIARRQVGLNEPQYRTLLRNVACVESSKHLGNRGLEDVMAVLEEMGFRYHGQPSNYWRDKCERRQQGEVTANQVWAIHAMGAQAQIAVGGFCHRMSRHRTDRPEDLTALEAYGVIEGLKAIIARGENTDAGSQAATHCEAGPKGRKSCAPGSDSPGRYSEVEEEIPF